MTTFSQIVDPNSRVLIELEWSAWLGEGETITEAEWTVTGPYPRPTIETDSDEIDGTQTRCWVSGTTDRKYHVLTCHVTTDAEWEVDQSVTLIGEQT